MKKYILLVTITCFTLVFTSSCSFFNHSSNTEVSASKDNTEESKSDDTLSDSQKGDESNTPESPNTDDTKALLEIQTIEGYVLSSDGNTMYVDLENTGSRLYPGEGEDRKVAFDISNAEQIQTNVSEYNPASDHLIRSGIQVTIEYYVRNGVNIATQLTSDGDEKEPYSPVAIGKVIDVSDSKITISITEGDNVGETVDFYLSDCDPLSEIISVDSQVAVAYYTNQDINYAVYIESMP